MGTRHHFIPRGSKEETHLDPRRCILMGDTLVAAELDGISGNRATVRVSQPLRFGARVELHHAEAGMITGNVVGMAGNLASIAFNTGNRAMRFAISRLRRAACPA